MFRRIFVALLFCVYATCALAQMSMLGFGPGNLSTGGGGTTYMKAPLLLLGYGTTALVNSGTQEYLMAAGAGSGAAGNGGATLATFTAPIATAGTLCDMAALEPGWLAGSWAFTLYHGTTPTNPTAKNLTVTVNSTSVASDTTVGHCETVAAGDFIAVGYVGTTTPTQSTTYLSMLFTSTVGQEAPFIGGTASSSNLTSGDYYFPFGQSVANANDVNVSALITEAGKIDHLYIYTKNAPSSTNSWTATVYHYTNGGTTSACAAGSATSLAATISGVATTNSDLSDSFTVAAGDCVSINWTCSGACTASPGAWSMRWSSPASNYDYPVAWNASGAISGTASTTRYESPEGFNVAGAATTEVTSDLIPPAGTFFTTVVAKLLTAQTSTAPGGATTRTFNMGLGTATPLTYGVPHCQTNTVAGCQSSDTQTVPASNLINWDFVNSSGSLAANTWAKGALVLNIQ